MQLTMKAPGFNLQQSAILALWIAEGGGARIGSQPVIYSKFSASPDHMVKSFLKTNKKQGSICL